MRTNKRYSIELKEKIVKEYLEGKDDRMKKTKKHKAFSIEEKNQIVILYLDRHMGRAELLRAYTISSESVLHRWIEQYREYGTCVDNRGKATKLEDE